MDGQYDIDEKHFMEMSVEQQNWLLFTTFNSYRTEKQRECDGRILECKKRFLTKDDLLKSKTLVVAALIIAAIYGVPQGISWILNHFIW